VHLPASGVFGVVPPLTCLKPSGDDLTSRRVANEYPTGVTLNYLTNSIDDALDVCKHYCRGG